MVCYLLHVYSPLLVAFNRFRAKVYLGDLSSVFRAAYDSMSGDGRAVLAFSTEAPPRSGSANEHEGTLAEAGFFFWWILVQKNICGWTWRGWGWYDTVPLLIEDEFSGFLIKTMFFSGFASSTLGSKSTSFSSEWCTSVVVSCPCCFAGQL